MNPRDAITFLRSPTGAFLGFCVLLVVAFIFVKGFAKPSEEKPNPVGKPEKTAKPQILETITHEIVPFRPPVKNEGRDYHENHSSQKPNPEIKPAFTPISLFAETPVSDPIKPLGKLYAPYGRLIPCELVVTVDSSSLRTPIIGLITEDIYHNGRLIIPAGTEVHGTAQTDRTRERIASSGQWTLVWHGGEELRLSGIALDREKNSTGEGWGITDGSAGLRGRVLKSDDLAEIKLFAATFLSGAASALTEKTPTIFGPQVAPSLQNAPLQGAQDVLTVYAKQILDTIQHDGFYVRVPAGKEFYLYVTQTIDKSEAALGGTRLTPAQEATLPRTHADAAPRPTIEPAALESNP